MEERDLTKATHAERRAREHLLAAHGLKVPGGEEFVVGLYEGDRLVATGALVGNTLQGIAVSPDFQGEGLSAGIVTPLLKRALEKNPENVFIFTKPDEARLFAALGFSRISGTKKVVLLEWKRGGIEGFEANLRTIASRQPEDSSAVVVNCNPFTLGHRWLIEHAARNSPHLFILVVEEDRSLFPFSVRLDLVRKGTADLSNVTVLPGGPYVISSSTFPSYFTRDEELTEVHAELDVTIFAEHIAPPLKVVRRCVGTEPYCPVTAAYNQAMKKTLIPRGIKLEEYARVERDGAPVSASRVRELIRLGRIEETASLLPESTFAWLRSPEAEPIVRRIVESRSRH